MDLEYFEKEGNKLIGKLELMVQDNRISKDTLDDFHIYLRNFYNFAKEAHEWHQEYKRQLEQSTFIEDIECTSCKYLRRNDNNCTNHKSLMANQYIKSPFCFGCNKWERK